MAFKENHTHAWGFPSGSVVKKPPAMQEMAGLCPGLGRSPGESNGNLIQYSCLGNPTDREAWKATVQGVIKSQTRLSSYMTTTICAYTHTSCFHI